MWDGLGFGLAMLGLGVAYWLISGGLNDVIRAWRGRE